MKSLGLRSIIIFFLIIVSVITFLPNLIDVSKMTFLPQTKINYGLDIRGGLHLVMGVDIDSVIEEVARRTPSTVESYLNTEGLDTAKVDLKVVESETRNSKFQMTISGLSAEQSTKVTELLSKNYPNLQLLGEGTELTYKLSDLYLNDLGQKTLEQSIETIRNRIDEFGVAEPSIVAQGVDRILVQLPGIEDATRAKDLINRTARLDFMMLETAELDIATLIADAEKAGNLNLAEISYTDYVKAINLAVKDKLPKDSMILFAKDENADSMQIAKVPYLVKTDTNLGGDTLKDAFVTYDEYNRPAVSLSFNPNGANRFATLTGENIGKQMAIVLDQVVYSAPVIQSRIPDGNAQITMNTGRDFQKNIDEAKNISMALRAGALPARLEQLEERTVGPSLGADSIAAGKLASYVAALLIISFTIFYYKTFGVIAVVCLGMNIFFLLSLLTALGATLTLPGIAGIALTLGMAVDANVIIYERIKEELAKGSSFKKAIEDGFTHAFSAIFDSNLTTGITSVILMTFGTGPVRGFAVTLILGMITSMFTALFVNRAILDWLTVKLGVKKLSI